MGAKFDDFHNIRDPFVPKFTDLLLLEKLSLYAVFDDNCYI